MQTQIEDEPIESAVVNTIDIPEDLIVQVNYFIFCYYTLFNQSFFFKLSGMGYDVELARLCLKAFNSNIQKSIEYLLTSNENNKDEILRKLHEIVEKHSGATAASSASASIEKVMQAKKAKELIYKDAPEDEEEYLDFNLDDDALFINKYYSLLAL